MAREKVFILRYEIGNQFYRADKRYATDLAHSVLRLLSDETPLRGPRGGRYMAVGNPYDYQDGEDGDAFIRNVRVFVAKQRARYVRPHVRVPVA